MTAEQEIEICIYIVVMAILVVYIARQLSR